MSLFKNVVDCAEYDQAAANLQDDSSPESVEKFGGLTTSQALKLCMLECRLHRRDILLFRRLTRMLTRYDYLVWLYRLAVGNVISSLQSGA